MSTYCERLQVRLSEEGVSILKTDKHAEEHVVSCSACFEFLEGLKALDESFLELAALDAPDELVERALAAVAKERGKAQVTQKHRVLANRPVMRSLVYALLSVTLVIVVVPVIASLLGSRQFRPFQPSEIVEHTFAFIEGSGGALLMVGAMTAALVAVLLGVFSKRRFMVPVPALLSVALLMFVTRASTTTFFSTSFNQIAAPLPGVYAAKSEPQNRYYRSPEEKVSELRELDNFGDYRRTEPPAPPQEEPTFHDQRDTRARTVHALELAGDEEEVKAETKGIYTAIIDQLREEAEKADAVVDRQDLLPAIPPGYRAVQQEPPRAPEAQAPATTEVISPGDTGTVRLLGGVSGPVDGTPAPVIFSLDGPISKPEGGSLGVGNAAIVASAMGAKNDQGRTEYRLKELRTIDEKGNEQRVQVDGWIVGSDGERGLPEVTDSSKDGDKIAHIVFSKEAELRLNKKAQVGERPKVAGESDDSPAVQEAKNFIAEYASLTNVNFQEPTGYWRNTYVPGDPQMRFLQHELTRSIATREKIASELGTALKLHQQARQFSQPFDAPKNSALALYLQSDAVAVNQPTRMRLQIGLQGSDRHGGKRPAMNLGVILDLGDLPSAENGAAIRALISEIGKAKDLGDRFSLTVAGKNGGTVIEPDNFTFGQITVKLQELLAGEHAGGEKMDLSQSFAAAKKRVQASDDPDSPLGSSALILITARELGGELENITRLAHQSAVDGIPISVIGIGKSIRGEELERLALFGQGRRRLIQSAAEAERVVGEELSSVSRVVARALRLRIHLHPGVKLIDVIGSERLDTNTAEQVRESERSIDQRVSRNTGIAADRGEDEEGIQIVIPSFYASDSHVILLDVVAAQPGPIADVTARYKDLVFLKNGVEKASLTLGSEERTASASERSVLKNLLAEKVARSMEQTGSALEANNTPEAIRILERAQTILQGMYLVQPEFARDRELQADIEMLSEYLLVLKKASGLASDERAYLLHSLRYASSGKTVSVSF